MNRVETSVLQQVFQTRWCVSPVIVRNEMPPRGKWNSQDQPATRFQTTPGFLEKMLRIENMLQRFRAQDDIRGGILNRPSVA
jgi:hypothetical protein